MKIESNLTGRTLDELLDEFDGFKHDGTFDSIEIIGNAQKPSLEDFKAKYEDLKIRVIPFELLRIKRDSMLSETDKYVTIDYPHPTPEIKQAWLDYRQALRDIPTNTTDPENPMWPEAPTP